MPDLKITNITSEVMGDIKKVENDQLKGWREIKTPQPQRKYKTNMKEFEEAIGHKTKGLVQIPLETVEKLLRVYGKRGRDALSIYTFLQAKSIKDNDRFKTNNRPWAQREYCLKGLHMSRKTYDPANTILLQEGLKKNRKNRDQGGRFVKKDYIELPFINLQKNANPHNEKARKVDKSTIRPQKPHCGVGTTSTDGTYNINTDTSFGKPKKITSTTSNVISDEVQHTTRYQKIPYGEDWKVNIGFELSDKDIDFIRKRTKGVGQIRNSQNIFNGNQESAIADGRTDHVPTTRLGYLIAYSNWLLKIDQSVTKKKAKFEVRRDGNFVYYSDGSIESPHMSPYYDPHEEDDE